MDGLLLKLLDDSCRAPGVSFWKMFLPIHQDLDRLFWCFSSQPWMGPPSKFEDDEIATESFDGEGNSSVVLWRPGSLSRYAENFAEEYIQLWGIEPHLDDPRHIAADYNVANWRSMGDIPRRYARLWMFYSDSTCWEVFARKATLLNEIRTHLLDKPWVKVISSHIDRRGDAFAAAGLAECWSGMYGSTG